MKKRYLFKLVLLFITLLMGMSAMADSPRIKPDWSEAKRLTLNLSGQKVTFILPSNTSSEFPSMVIDSMNIYDPESYDEWRSKELAAIWWDYKKKEYLLFSSILGTLAMSVIIHDRNAKPATDLFKSDVLENALREHYKRAFPDPDESYQVPEIYTPVVINGKQWLKYINRGPNSGGESSDDRLCFAIPITSSHFLEVSFRVMEADERSEKNWYAVSQEDIDKIIHSFNVTYTESAHDK